MPKLKRSFMRPEDQGYDCLVRFIAGRTGRKLDYTQEQLAEKAGIAPSTFSRRMNHKGQFTHEELCRLFRILNPTDEEILSFFGRNPQKGRKSA